MQPSIFNVRVPLPERNEVFLMNTLTDAQHVVSPAVAGSERVAREVHLAGAEHTPVVPVLLATTELPDDLAHYLDLRPPIDLRPDRAEGLRRLVDEVNTIPRKRVARPRRAIAAAVVVVTLFVAAWVGSRILLG